MFWVLLKKPIVQNTCNIDLIENTIRIINEQLSHCCDCNNQQDAVVNPPPVTPPPVTPPPVTPPNISACNGQADDNGRNVPPPPKYFEVGNQSGTIRLCYDNGNTYPDNIIVKHNGHILRATGQVIGNNCVEIPFVYHPGDPTFVEVNVQPSSDVLTRWSYTLGCPQ